MPWQGFFFVPFQFFDVAEVVILHKMISQIWLRTRDESRKNQNPVYSWLPTGTYHENLAICKPFFFKIWQIWVIILHGKSFV
jgi:hypothetical protein